MVDSAAEQRPTTPRLTVTAHSAEKIRKQLEDRKEGFDLPLEPIYFEEGAPIKTIAAVIRSAWDKKERRWGFDFEADFVKSPTTPTTFNSELFAQKAARVGYDVKDEQGNMQIAPRKDIPLKGSRFYLEDGYRSRKLGTHHVPLDETRFGRTYEEFARLIQVLTETEFESAGQPLPPSFALEEPAVDLRDEKPI